VFAPFFSKITVPMSYITCKATKAKISKERAAKAQNALEKQLREIATQQKQQDSPVPFIFLDKRDDEVKAAMDAFQSVR
jgi:membrane carboxypeptidase/penicillin-binding protein PbpC